MNAFLVTGNNKVKQDAGLAKVMEIVFKPASAKASVSGENRGLAASALARHIPAMGRFDSMIIELENETGTIITIEAENLVVTLGKITNAYNLMQEAREAVEAEDKAYKMIRSSVDTIVSGEKKQRGRHAGDKASEYASLLTS